MPDSPHYDATWQTDKVRYAALEERYAPKPFDAHAFVARNTTIADAKAVIHQLIAELRALKR